MDNPFIRSLRERWRDLYSDKGEGVSLSGQLNRLLGVGGEEEKETIDDLARMLVAHPFVNELMKPIERVELIDGGNAAGSWIPESRTARLKYMKDPYAMLSTILHEGGHAKDLPLMNTPVGLYSNEMNKGNILSSKGINEYILEVFGGDKYVNSKREAFARLLSGRLMKDYPGTKNYRLGIGEDLGSIEKELPKNRIFMRFGQD